MHGRLIVASANMTAPGLSGNLEVVGEIRASVDEPTCIPLLRAALEYFAPFLKESVIPRRQVEWAMERTEWLALSTPAPAQVLEGGRLVAFLGSHPEEGIANRFVQLVAGRPVKRLIVVSPYWDADLHALNSLKAALSPSKTAVLIQPKAGLFPIRQWPVSPHAALFDLAETEGVAPSRFAHAKIFIAETASGDCVLFGSANCTTAALGGAGHSRRNDEATLYRELAAGQAVRLLGLQQALRPQNALPPAKVAEFHPPPAIPLTELTQRLPGRFELSSNLLRWWPATSFTASNAQIALLGHDGEAVTTGLRRMGSECNPVSYE